MRCQVGRRQAGTRQAAKPLHNDNQPSHMQSGSQAQPHCPQFAPTLTRGCSTLSTATGLRLVCLLPRRHFCRCLLLRCLLCGCSQLLQLGSPTLAALPSWAECSRCTLWQHPCGHCLLVTRRLSSQQCCKECTARTPTGTPQGRAALTHAACLPLLQLCLLPLRLRQLSIQCFLCCQLRLQPSCLCQPCRGCLPLGAGGCRAAALDLAHGGWRDAGPSCGVVVDGIL